MDPELPTNPASGELPDQQELPATALIVQVTTPICRSS